MVLSPVPSLSKVVSANVITCAPNLGVQYYLFVIMFTSKEATNCIISHFHKTKFQGRMISVENMGAMGPDLAGLTDPTPPDLTHCKPKASLWGRSWQDLHIKVHLAHKMLLLAAATAAHRVAP